MWYGIEVCVSKRKIRLDLLRRGKVSVSDCAGERSARWKIHKVGWRTVCWKQVSLVEDVVERG